MPSITVISFSVIVILLVVFTASQISIPKTESSAYASSSNQTINVYDESPLKQFKAGLPLYMIACKLGLYPIQKISDHTPACVTKETFKILIQRGWGTYMPSPPINPGGPVGGLFLINKTK
ncbi:MAG: hypothetical protein WBF38_05595 [Nitrosotalea sp.]